MTYGLDIFYGDDAPSTYQRIDFNKMYAAGARFVIIKATDNGFVDPLFIDSYTRAKDAGLLVGAYHFLRWTVPVENQMSVFTSLIKDHPCDLPPTVDAEYRNSIPDKGRVMAWINTCRILMTKATGKEAMIYTSPDFWKTEGSLDVGWTRSPLWQANYFTSMTKMLPEAVTPDMWPVPIPPWKRISFWQYTSHGDGLKYGIESKDADIDLFNGTYDDLLKFCGLDNEPVPPTPPPPAHPLPLEDRLGNLEREAVIHGWNIPVPV